MEQIRSVKVPLSHTHTCLLVTKLVASDRQRQNSMYFKSPCFVADAAVLFCHIHTLTHSHIDVDIDFPSRSSFSHTHTNHYSVSTSLAIYNETVADIGA